MIECKIGDSAQDITPEMVVSAYNVLREYCKQHEDCYEECVLYDICGDALVLSPDNWPELKNP